ncbi:50S ribosomal protein L14 [Hypoxylon sp. EC38]|nr:50S ribosomal protein L14 [Hypoxylon sp. EC38]
MRPSVCQGLIVNLDRCSFRPRPATKLEFSLGDRIVAIVQKQRGASDAGMGVASAANKVKRGDIRHAIVVRTRKQVQRPDGSVVRFDDNACVLINKAGDPIGTRVNGVVGAELRRRGWSKILSMAPAHA